jgi:hypothetical protein
MYFTELPHHLTLTLSARLSGLSSQAFRRVYLETGLVTISYDVLFPNGNPRPFVYRYVLEAALGREITLDECRAAYGKGAARRRYQRFYRRKAVNQQTGS